MRFYAPDISLACRYFYFYQNKSKEQAAYLRLFVDGQHEEVHTLDLHRCIHERTLCLLFLWR